MQGPEKLFPIATAVEKVTGQRHHPSTYHRWRLRGIAGVRLETKKCGGRRMCSLEAVERFLDAVTTASDHDDLPQPRTVKQEEREIEKVLAELEAEGI